MKTFALLLSILTFGLLAAGCGHLDTTPMGSAERVLSGVVTNGTGGGELPANAEVNVRIVDYSRGAARGEVLGEADIKNPPSLPVSFKIEYLAEDAVLMRSVAVEARIAVNGQLRYTMTNSHPLTLGNVNDPHTLVVSMVGQP